jgi:methionyl-tRNA formyltransferase
MRLLFLGSPSVAVPFLEACAASEHEIALVITQPDKPSGRGMSLTPPPVKKKALELGLTVLQPTKIKEIETQIQEAQADLAVVVAYGKLLKPRVLEMTRLGFMNVHFSLLPKYRGAAPLQWSLINGEKETGVTLFWITEGMDEGPIQSMAHTVVDANEDARSLFARLVELGVQELLSVLNDCAAGRIIKEPQTGEASLAPKILPEAARLDLSMRAQALHDRVRGLRAGPKPYFSLNLPGRSAPLRLTVLKTQVESAKSGTLGEILHVDREKGILVQLTDGQLWLQEVQPEGKKPQIAADFLNGSRLKIGDRLTVVAG